MSQAPLRFFLNKKSLFIAYLIFGLVSGLQAYLLDSFNNFTIFKNSVINFYSHQNLYVEYPTIHHDVFLYNPTFCVLFTPFAYLPEWLGIPLWCMVVSAIFFMAIYSLDISKNAKFFILYLIIPELISSIQNMQTNGLVVAFIIFSMTLLNRKQHIWVPLFPSLGFFIKGYGAISGVFILLKSSNVKHYLFGLIQFVLIGSLPLLFYSFEEFITLYKQWFWSLNQDYDINVGLSVMGLIQKIVYSKASIAWIQGIAVVFLLVSLVSVRIRKNYEEMKYFILAYLLIWVIIFNQSSESATYIIASTGCLIWFIHSKKTTYDLILLGLLIILTIFSSSDIFPRYLRETYVLPYALKALPPTLIWFKIQSKLFFPNPIFLKKSGITR